MRWSSIASVAGLAAAVVFLPGCGSELRSSQHAPRTADRAAVIFNGATVERKVERALTPTSPAPLETEEEREARVRGLSLQAMPCGVRVESIPHGIAITFFTRAGAEAEAQEIRDQVELISRMHNKLFQVPEATVEGGPETVPMNLDRSRPDHAPLRAMMAIPARAAWEETSDGARLVLTTDSEQDLADLRAHVRWHAPELLPEVMSERKRCPDVPEDFRAQLYYEQ